MIITEIVTVTSNLSTQWRTNWGGLCDGWTGTSKNWEKAASLEHWSWACTSALSKLIQSSSVRWHWIELYWYQRGDIQQKRLPQLSENKLWIWTSPCWNLPVVTLMEKSLLWLTHVFGALPWWLGCVVKGSHQAVDLMNPGIHSKRWEAWPRLLLPDSSQRTWTVRCRDWLRCSTGSRSTPCTSAGSAEPPEERWGAGLCSTEECWWWTTHFIFFSNYSGLVEHKGWLGKK